LKIKKAVMAGTSPIGAKIRPTLKPLAREVGEGGTQRIALGG
jgi:hypothetical protein